MTHQEHLLWLAELGVDCTLCRSWKRVSQDKCPACHDSGKLPCFPMLRRECSCLQKSAIVDCCDECFKAGKHSEKCFCQGRGWLPVDSGDATVEAMASEGIDGAWRAPHGVVGYWYIEVDKGHEMAGVGKGSSFNKAGIKVLYEVMKAGQIEQS